jgi:ribonucleoside-diphosphate reductase alpha chain
MKSADDFRECCRASSLIGTLQAGYTHFPYLSNAASQLTEDEALLGCSITGIMENEEIILDPANQQEMARLILKVNAEWAAKLGINPAARTTCCKPEGTGSLVLGSSSGIHFHHAHRYFRRVQCNKLDPVYKHFKKHNPHACEPSVWSENHTDDVVSFPIQVDPSIKTKQQVGAIEHLEMIKSTQQNWVRTGTSPTNKKPIEHNVSCTVIVKENEWKEVSHYLYKNRDFFAAVSLLSATGDKLYPQAPNEAIISAEDEKIWDDLIKSWKRVDYTKLKEDEDLTNLSSEAACAGGVCEIVSV